MEQNRKLRNKPAYIWSINLWRVKIIQWGKDSLFDTVLGKLDSHMPKNENWPLSYTIHKN